ncbi:hypothetical protein B0H17DRAFT_1143968 [Mycena rosella]|uniref:Uncharacterized protein n=1 Tax=Mycena rosella TaxID=1033263 RepID=A0AAD7G3Y9_MYCRO|nr:hypothetical protein B0H17DRAFT_1143968 [Mycena rosella]
MLSRKREREHRRSANAKPYAKPTFYPSRQPRVFAPSSEADEEDAGPSGTRSPSPDHDIEMPLELDPDAQWDMVSNAGARNAYASDSEALPGPSEGAENDFVLEPPASIPYRAPRLFPSAAENSEDEGNIDDGRGEDPDDDPDLFDWESFKAPTDGLAEWEKLGESYEAEAAAIAHKLSTYDLAICRAFSYKVQTNTTDRAFKKLPRAFPQAPPLPKLDALRARINFLAGFKPEIYDCCINSCLCYAGPNADLTSCPYCKEPRRRANGKSRKKFTYIPLIPRLVAFAGNRDIAEKHQYRAEHQCF